MTIYDLVFEKIQEKYENGEYTIEEAEALNDLAYDRYVNEGAFKKYRDMQYAEKQKLIDDAHNLVKKQETIGHGSQSVNKRISEKLTQVGNKLNKCENENNYARKTNGAWLDQDVDFQNILDKKKPSTYGHADGARFTESDYRKHLLDSKKTFRDKTSGPEKRVINPDNTPNRYGKLNKK